MSKKKCNYSISQHIVECTSDDGSQSAQAGPGGVFSGNAECENNPSCSSIKDRGPTPPGTYDMVSSEKYGGSWWLKQGFWTRQFCKLGFGRCEFFFHEGTISAGCITVNKNNQDARNQFKKIQDLLRTETNNTMTVTP